MMKVSRPLAIFFYEQCVGTYTGHMANVPNNPTLSSLVHAHVEGINITDSEFADFLNAVADSLRGKDDED